MSRRIEVEILQNQKQMALAMSISANIIIFVRRLFSKFIKYEKLTTTITIINIDDKTKIKKQKLTKGTASNVLNGDVIIDINPIKLCMSTPPNKPYANVQI